MQSRQGQRDKVSEHFTTSKHFCRQPKTLVNAVFPDPALQKEKLRQRFLFKVMKTYSQVRENIHRSFSF